MVIWHGRPRYGWAVSDGWVDDGWEAAVAAWKTELDLQGWVTLAEAEAATGVSRSALRSWYRKGEVPSRVEAGRHGPQRMVELEAVLERVARSPRLSRRSGTSGPPVDDGSVRTLIDLLAAQIDRAEARAATAEAALRAAVERAAAAEAERDVLRRLIP